MIDLAELRSQFPDLADITPFGSGGQKEVCRAEFQGKKVALKLILPNPDSEERTVREIHAIRQLSLPCVPHVIESGERMLCGQKRLYIVEDFIEGHTYREILQKQPVQDFFLVMDLARVLLDAAADFERINLVHRDIKPENIMKDTAGKIWILAKQLFFCKLIFRHNWLAG